MQFSIRMVFEIVLATIMGLITLPLVVVAIIGHRRYSAAQRLTAEQRRRNESLSGQVSALYAAATDSDEEVRRELGGRNVNLQNPDGHSALHLAYHSGDADAVARLVALGADETLRDQDGFTPAEMVELAAAETLLEQAVACMTGCQWRDREQGRRLYQSLKQSSPRLYNPALVRVALRSTDYRSIVCLAVKVGLPGSEERLVSLLEGHGTKEIATHYLNSGSRVLAVAARRWAASRGYTIHYTGHGGGVRWGSF